MPDLTIKQIEKGLRSTGGFISLTAKKLGVTQGAISNRIKTSEKLKKALAEISESQLDFTESKLLKLIKEGNPAAVFFMLKCKGKHRGYIERVEQHVEVTTKNPLEIKGLDIKKLD